MNQNSAYYSLNNVRRYDKRQREVGFLLARCQLHRVDALGVCTVRCDEIRTPGARDLRSVRCKVGLRKCVRPRLGAQPH